MTELVTAMLQAPERIADLNKQFSSQPALVEAWLKAILEYPSPEALRNDAFIFNALGVARNVFQQYEITPAQTQGQVELLSRVALLLSGFNGFLVLRQLFETGCVPHVGVREVASVLWGLLERNSSLRPSLVGVMRQVGEQLLEAAQLQRVLVSPSFQRQAKAGKELSQAVSLQQFVQLCSLMLQYPGSQLGVFSATFQTLLQLDIALECTGRQLQISSLQETVRGEITNSVVNSLRAFNAVFGVQLEKASALEFEANQDGMRQQAVSLDRELQGFLDKHPELLGYYRRQLLETLDVGLDYLIEAMQSQPAELLGDFATAALSGLLTVRSRYVQFVLFPLVQVQELQQSLVQVLFTTAFASPQTGFESAQLSAQYLMSLAARCTNFDALLLEQLLRVLVAYCLQMDEVIAPELASPGLGTSAQFLRFALAVKSVMYLVVFLWPQLQEAEGIQATMEKFCALRSGRAVFGVFPYVLEEFLGVLQRVELVDGASLEAMVSIFRGLNAFGGPGGADGQGSPGRYGGVLTEFYPFEPVDLEASARWIQGGYRSLGGFE